MANQRVDGLTVVGLGMAMMPLMTMWHEIGGHAAACALQGGRVAELGAFYVECKGLAPGPDMLVALAGVTLNGLLCALAYRLWRGARGDRVRLVLWLLWVSQGFVAAGYFCFSGVSGIGDLGTGARGSLAALPYPVAIRIAELVIGIAAYVWLVRAAIASLGSMLGTGPATAAARRTIGLGFYLSAGAGAVLVGLLNPVGLFITILSAAASSFGGLGGLWSVAFAVPGPDRPRDFFVPRSPAVLLIGAAILAGFAGVLGRTIRL